MKASSASENVRKRIALPVAFNLGIAKEPSMENVINDSETVSKGLVWFAKPLGIKSLLLTSQYPKEEKVCKNSMFLFNH